MAGRRSHSQSEASKHANRRDVTPPEDGATSGQMASEYLRGSGTASRFLADPDTGMTRRRILRSPVPPEEVVEQDRHPRAEAKGGRDVCPARREFPGRIGEAARIRNESTRQAEVRGGSRLCCPGRPRAAPDPETGGAWAARGPHAQERPRRSGAVVVKSLIRGEMGWCAQEDLNPQPFDP